MKRYTSKLLNSLKWSGSLVSIKTRTLHFSSFTANTASSCSLSLPENLASYLENCSDIVSLKKLHAFSITLGLEQNTLLGSKLINSYARFNLLEESKLVFDKIVNKSLSLWNSIIVGYFKTRQCGEVLELYSKLRKTSIGIHSSALTFGLKSCVELGNGDFGRTLHTDAFKFGFSSDQFVGSSLIGFYSKCDLIEDAIKVFDELTEKDMVVYTTMITGFSQVRNGSAKMAFKIAYDMQKDGFEPNRVTLISLLQCASRLGLLEEGKSIHGYALRREIGFPDEVFDTSVLSMYINCGDLSRGTIILEKMNKITTASWNALIAGYLKIKQPLEAYKLLLQMVHDKNKFDLIAFANGLLICADLGCLLIGKAIHCQTIRGGTPLDLVGNTALVEMYCKCNHLVSAENVFYRTEDKDGISFNAMISGYLQNGYSFEATDTFREMINKSIRPNIGAIINILSALSDVEDIRACKCVHGYTFRHGLDENTDLGNQLINIYAKCGLIEYFIRAFNRIKVKDRLSWTCKMTALANHNLSNEALTLFRLTLRENIQPDSITFTSLLQVINKLGSINLVREVHGRLYRVFFKKDTGLSNVLLTTYSKCGKVNFASNLFEKMSERDLSSWNTMIAAYGMHGDCIGAIKLFETMKYEKISPDGVTFNSILSACSHTGSVKEGLDAFNSMEGKYGIIPSDVHYCCVVDLLGRAGRIEEAYELLKSVPSRQNGSTLGALLSACRVHGNSEIGERVGKWLLQVDPQNTSVYCSVSNLHAGGGRWDEVANVGDIAKEKGLKRITGFSFVDY